MSDFDRLLGDSLKSIRDEHVRSIESQVPAARARIERKVNRGRFTFVAGGTALAAAALAVAVFVVQAAPTLDRATPNRPTGYPQVVAAIDVPGVAFMDTGLGSLWVTHENGIVEIDPSTSSIGIESPVAPVDGIDLNSEAMYAIDLVGQNVSRIPFGSDEGAISAPLGELPTQIVASDDGVWAVAQMESDDGSTHILGLDASDLGVESELPYFPGGTVADIAYADGELWASTSFMPGSATADNYYRVSRIDPGEEGTVEYIPLTSAEGAPADVAIGAGAVWILRFPTRDGGNVITRVDIETGAVEERAVTLPDSLESIAFGEGYLWATTAPLGMDMPDDARSSLHRIDPETLGVAEPLEVAGPGSKVVAGEGYVWVGDPNSKQVVQIDPTGAPSPEPTPSEEPSAEPTDDAAPDKPRRCATHIPFESGDPAFEVGVGSGGQKTLPLAQQNPRAVIHFARGSAFVDVTIGDPMFPNVDGEDIEILGSPGVIGGIHEGFTLDFSVDGCDYQLLAYGLAFDETRRFGEALEFRGGAGSTTGFTLWPETTPEDAYVSCRLAQRTDNPARAGSLLMLNMFAMNILEWTDAVPTPLDIETTGGLDSVQVRLEHEDGPAIQLDVGLREVAHDCWSVVSVRTVDEDGESYLSVEKRDGTLTVRLDISHEPQGESVASVELLGGFYGEALDSDRMNVREGRSDPLQVSGLSAEPTAFVLLLRDEQGETIGAIGMTLPSGDFAAG